MITEIEARNIALRHLANMENDIGEPLKLADSETIERSFGWVFFYNSKDYLETGKFSSMLAGNAPFIVDRNNGDIHETGTEKPIEDYIYDYERRSAGN